jgi:hypothetical protein
MQPEEVRDARHRLQGTTSIKSLQLSKVMAPREDLSFFDSGACFAALQCRYVAAIVRIR